VPDLTGQLGLKFRNGVKNTFKPAPKWNLYW